MKYCQNYNDNKKHMKQDKLILKENLMSQNIKFKGKIKN
jgi:hypothetical protein